MTQSKSLGIQQIIFVGSSFRGVVIQDISGNFRLRDGRPLRKVDESTYEVVTE
jgi:hypothetical protein